MAQSSLKDTDNIAKMTKQNVQNTNTLSLKIITQSLPVPPITLYRCLPF